MKAYASQDRKENLHFSLKNEEDNEISYTSEQIKTLSNAILSLIKAFDNYTLNPCLRDMASTLEAVSQFYTDEEGAAKISIQLHECYNFMVSFSSILYFKEQGNEVCSSNEEISRVLRSILKEIEANFKTFNLIRNEPFYNYMLTEGQHRLDDSVLDSIYMADADLATQVVRVQRICMEMIS